MKARKIMGINNKQNK